MNLQSRRQPLPAPANNHHIGTLTPGFHAGQVVTLSAAHALNDTYSSFLPPLLPTLIAKLALSNTQAGLLTVFQSTPSLLQPMIGHFADRLDLRYVVIFAPAVTGLMLSLLGAAPSYVLVALCLLLGGVSSASFHSVGPAMAGSLGGPKLGRTMSIWMVGGEIGFTIGPIVAVTAVKVLSLEGMPWLSIVGMIGSLILFAALRKVPVHRPSLAKPEPWTVALGAMTPVMLPIMAIIGARSLAAAAVGAYLPTLLTGEGMDLWRAGASLSLLQASGAVGVLIAGSLSDIIGRRRVLVASIVITSACLFLFLNAQGWLRPVALILLGLGMVAIDPVALAVVQESYPANRALASSTYMAMTFVIRSFAVVVNGAVGDHYGLRAAFGMGAVVILLGLPLVRLLPRPGPRGV